MGGLGRGRTMCHFLGLMNKASFMNKLETGHDRTDTKSTKNWSYVVNQFSNITSISTPLTFPFSLLSIAQAMNRVQLRFYAALSS